MRPEFRVGLLASLLFAVVAHAAPADKFAYGYPIQADGGAPAYVVALPQDAYAWTRPGTHLGDVIVVDATGRQVPSSPYLPAQTVSKPVALTLPLLAVPGTAAGTVGPRIERSTNGDIIIQPGPAVESATVKEWLVDARVAIAATSVTFPPTQVRGGADVQLDNVSIDVSDDLQSWTSLVRQATIMSVGHSESAPDVSVVKVSGAAGRYYRVRIVSGDVDWAVAGQPTLHLEGLVDTRLTADEATRQWLDVTPSKGNGNGQGVDYDYKLPAALPIDALRLKRGSDTVARLDAMALTGGQMADPLGTLVVTSAQGDGTTTLAVGGGRLDALRLHSATPLREPPHLAVGWRPDRFVFLPEGQAPYRLLVGSAQARRPAWPMADALAGLRKQQPEGWRPAEAVVGPGDRVDGEDAVAAPNAPFDWTRVILWIVLGLGVVVVGGMAMSLLRRPPPPREGP
jgi:hypothetical protein